MYIYPEKHETVDCTPKLPARDTNFSLSYFNYNHRGDLSYTCMQYVVAASHVPVNNRESWYFVQDIHSFNLAPSLDSWTGLWQQSGVYSDGVLTTDGANELARARE